MPALAGSLAPRIPQGAFKSTLEERQRQEALNPENPRTKFGPDAWEGNGPLKGLLLKPSVMRGGAFEDGGRTWLFTPDAYGNVFLLLVGKGTYTPGMFSTVSGQAFGMGQATGPEAMLLYNAWVALCWANMSKQGLSEHPDAEREREAIGLNSTAMIGGPEKSKNGYPQVPTGDAATDKVWNVSDCDVVNPDRVQGGNAYATGAFPCFNTTPEDPNSLQAKLRATAGMPPSPLAIPVGEQPWYGPVPFDLPVPEEHKGKWDGKVWCMVNGWTRQAVITGFRTLIGAGDLALKTFLGILEILAGIVLLIIPGGKPYGVALLSAGVGTIVGAWGDFAAKINAQQKAIAASTDPEILKRMGFASRLIGAGAGSGPGSTAGDAKKKPIDWIVIAALLLL